jgi:hypothetical protein
MKNQSSRLLGVLALIVAACAPAQPVANVYENPRIAGNTYTTILKVWTAQSTAFPKNNVDAASADVASAVARSLRAGGWLD